MSDAVLTLDGLTPRELGMGIFNKTQRPILSSTEDNVITIPYMHGAYDFGATLAPRQFSLECAFLSQDYRELQERVSNLATFLLDADGRPRSMSIIFANQPERQYTVRYSGDLQIDRIAGVGTFTLPFTAYDPFSYSTWESTDLNVDSEILVDNDILVDTGYTFTVTAPQTIAVINYGNQNIKPVIEIKGSFSNLVLTVNGVQFMYNQSISNGNLVIDYQRKTVKLNNTNALVHTNAKFGIVPVGTSNLVVSGANINVKLNIKFRQKYA